MGAIDFLESQLMDALERFWEATKIVVGCCLLPEKKLSLGNDLKMSWVPRELNISCPWECFLTPHEQVTFAARYGRHPCLFHRSLSALC